MLKIGDYVLVAVAVAVSSWFGVAVTRPDVIEPAALPSVSIPPAMPAAPSSVPSAKPNWVPPQNYHLESFRQFQGTYVGRDRMVVYNEEWVPQKQRYAGYLRINEDEVYCGFEGALPRGNGTGRPTESLNNPLDPLDGVWWVGHCTGTRFPAGGPRVLRVTAYWRWPAIYQEHDLYVVIGEMQYGPFRREYPATD